MPTKKQLHQLWESEFEFPETRREDDPMYVSPHCTKLPVMRSLPIAEILGEDQPWPLTDVLKKLIEASEILLHKKNYDGHGWEEIRHAVEVAKQKVRLLSGNDA